VAERAIYFTLRNFFFFSFLMISRRQIISRSTGQIFAIFTSNESILGVDDRSGPLFRYLKGSCHGNRFCAKMGQNSLPPALIALAFRNGMGLRRVCARLISITNATTLCKNLVKNDPVVSAEKILIEIALRVHVVVRRISSNISGCTGPMFAIFSPYESALRADDGSVLYFPICQGTLPW